MTAIFPAAMVLLTVVLAPNARADVNARSEHFADREVFHLTNSDSFPVNSRFSVSYDYKCNDEYTYWQHWDAWNQGASLNANDETNVVYYFPACASSTQVKNVVFQWISSVRADAPPKPSPQPAKPQPGNATQSGKNPQGGGTPQPGSPQPNSDSQQPYYDSQTQAQPQAASPCSSGPLGAWSARHTTALGRTVTVTLSNGVLSLRNEGKTGWNETYQIRLSQIDTNQLARLPVNRGVWSLTVDAKDEASVVARIDSKGHVDPSYTTGMIIEFNDSATQEWAATEIASLASQCGGYSLNDLLKRPAAAGPEALALELDSSASKRVEQDRQTPRVIDAFSHSCYTRAL